MKNILIFVFAAFCVFPASAQDRVFARTEQSNTLPKGVREIETWNTVRLVRNSYYSSLRQRIEFETGLTNRVQTSVYINVDNKSYSNAGDSTNQKFKSTTFSVSNEWKIKFSDPVVNGIGSCFYSEITWAPDELELEPKIILDKQFGKHLLAFNAVTELEFELEQEGGTLKANLEATPISLYNAYMYQFSPTFGLGFETLNHMEIVPGKGIEHAAFLAGPSIQYTSGKAFFILNFLPQLVNLNQAKVAGALDLDEYERFNIRLVMGYGL